MFSLKDISVAGKTYLISSVFMGGMLCIGLTSSVLMGGIEREMIEIAEEDVPLIRALTKVTVNSLEQAVLVEKILPSHKDVNEAKAYHQDFDDRSYQNQAAFGEALSLIARADELAATPEALKKLQEVGREIEDIQKQYSGYLTMAQEVFRKAETGETITMAERDEIEKVQKHVDHLIEEELLKIEEFAAAAAIRAEHEGKVVIWAIIAVSIVASIFGLIASWLLVRALAQPLTQMAGGISEMAKGNDVEIPCLGNGDELGTLARSLDEVLQRGLEATRLRQALDRCNTMMMVANRNHDIVYVNPALVNHLGKFESAIRADLPGFSSGNLIGTNIDTFHKNPSHNRSIVEGLRTTHEVDVKVGGRRLHLIINPVMNESGTLLGTVVEWADQTEDLTMRDSIDQLIRAVKDGDFEQRIDLAGVGEGHRELVGGMNALTEVVDNATSELGTILAAIAEGDLTKRISTDYQGRFGELKDNANQTAERLGEIVGQIQTATGEVSNAASEISTGTEDLSNRTEQAASNLEETAASTEEMAATVKQNADNAKNASELAGGADLAAKTGGEVVGQAVEAMAGIDQSAQKITDIIGVIDEIAFQTNLLALNASVEAARAGEAGKGFAVVAQEVRQLAQRSAQAASDIKTLIQDSNGQVKQGVELVNRAGETLSEIVASIGKVAGIVNEISSASQEQAIGVQEINGSVSSMDEMTQQNSALVEQSSAAARTLNDQATKLAELTDFFKIGGAGRPAQHRPAARSAAPSAAPRARAASPAPARPALQAADDDGWSEF